MKHFTLDEQNNIAIHASRKAANATGAAVFSTEGQFADLIGHDNKRLLAIWNGLPGVFPVTKFTNRKVALGRIWKFVEGMNEPDREHGPKADLGHPVPPVGEHPAKVGPQTTMSGRKARTPHKPVTGETKAKAARAGSKTAAILELLNKPGGTTLKSIVHVTGWQAHSVRGFISGTLGRRMGLTIVSAKGEEGQRNYSLES